MIVPALPEKSVVEKYKMAGDFIEARRAALNVFINRVVGPGTPRVGFGWTGVDM